MAYVVTGYESGKIDLAPDSLEKEVLQNVVMIISTPLFSVPLNRGFGLAQRFVDKPIPIAKSLIITEVMDAIEKYEPRAEVISVSVQESAEIGKLIPKVEVNIIGD